jgi:hypothetical protein
VDSDLIALIDKGTPEAGKCDHLTDMQREVPAVVVNAYPEVAASEALAAVREVWTRFNR